MTLYEKRLDRDFHGTDENSRILEAYQKVMNGGKTLNEENIIDEYIETIDRLNSLEEKWAKDVDIKPTGEHEKKTVAQLKKEIEALKGKPGNKEKMGELLFALRSKQGWKKGEGSTGL